MSLVKLIDRGELISVERQTLNATEGAIRQYIDVYLPSERKLEFELVSWLPDQSSGNHEAFVMAKKVFAHFPTRQLT